MLGWTLIRVFGAGKSLDLPDGSFALFRAVPRVKRSEIVLVDHPRTGKIVRKVAAISLNGRVALRSSARSCDPARDLGNIDPDWVKGRLALRMRWGRFLPRLFRRQPDQDRLTY